MRWRWRQRAVLQEHDTKLQQIDALFRRQKNDVARKQSMARCRNGCQGHLKRDCGTGLTISRKSTQQRSHRDVKGAGVLRNGFTGENKAASKVKIRSFTSGSSTTIPGKIYENPAAITIDTGAEVEPIPETIRTKTVTGESTPIMCEASLEICIGQLRIRHRALVAG